MFYKIQALFESGRKITLHYFDYNKRRNVDALRPFCHAIYSYKRSSFIQSLIQGLPYSVSSRVNKELIDRLNQDDHPILLEGFHCSGVIPFLVNTSRKVVVRVHNDEAKYYLQLSATERSLTRKWYFKRESKLLHNYQQQLERTIPLACISGADAEVFRAKYGSISVSFLPTFIPWQEITAIPGKGNYCLYHGNLNISENEAAVTWLIKEVFTKIDVPLFVAGKVSSGRLQSAINQSKNSRLITNPSASELDELVRHAHIHVLPSMNATGVKLKVLHALFVGRFCITNAAGIAGSCLESQAAIADTSEEYISKIQELMNRSFEQEDLAQRQKILKVYNNRQTAEGLNALL
jgi:hypothetical protein